MHEAASSVPQVAFAAFERMTGLHVAVHDGSGRLWPLLPPDRFEHLNPVCRSIKNLRQSACTAFDSKLVHQRATGHPQGFIKVCHAGLVEWVVLARCGALLFAGVRRPGPGLDQVVSDPAPLSHAGPWTAAAARLPAVSGDEAATTLELLRQLAARLDQWATDESPITGQKARPVAIRHFIQKHHSNATLSLDDLAQHLGISTSRAGHAVREACGKTFIALLTEARLGTAAGLLRHTDLAVERVATHSGFGNRTHFHAVFSRAMHVSPGAYRLRAAGHPQPDLTLPP